MKRFKTETTLLILVVLLGAFFRFYKLDWGQSLFTHPDEYHIAASVAQLSFPNQMHPHFFSYGTVTIYLIYFTRLLLSPINSTLYILHSTFLNPFLIGRFYSALFSTLTILLVYKITALGLEKKWALLAALLVALTPGLIQQAHFATPESNLTFFLFGSLLFLLQYIQSNKIPKLIYSSVFLGLALGIKVSSLVFAPTIFLAIIAYIRHAGLNPARLMSPILLFLLTTTITFFIVDPYVFLDFPTFKGNLDYEGGLAAGKFLVFYTRQFIDTTPVIFQFEKILPYTLGLPLLVAGTLGFILMVFSIFLPQKLSTNDFIKRTTILWRVLIITSFLLLFLFNSFLFAKWTRFIAPTFPFFAIFAVFFLSQLKSLKILKYLKLPILLLTFLWSLSFFSIYLREDVRLTASKWIEANAAPRSTFLVEGGNMVDLPLQGPYTRISLDFYALEDSSLARQQISLALNKSDYFLVQSRRVFMNTQRLPSEFPKAANFYNALFSGSLGFEQIKKFNSYPTLPLLTSNLEFPDEKAEETWSVFDHPVIRVFKKTKPLTVAEYSKLLSTK